MGLKKTKITLGRSDQEVLGRGEQGSEAKGKGQTEIGPGRIKTYLIRSIMNMIVGSGEAGPFTVLGQ